MLSIVFLFLFSEKIYFRVQGGLDQVAGYVPSLCKVLGLSFRTASSHSTLLDMVLLPAKLLSPDPHPPLLLSPATLGMTPINNNKKILN